jgi:hypothetical protein
LDKRTLQEHRKPRCRDHELATGKGEPWYEVVNVVDHMLTGFSRLFGGTNDPPRFSDIRYGELVV